MLRSGPACSNAAKHSHANTAPGRPSRAARRDPDHGRFMSLTGLDGALLALAVWGLVAAMLLPALAALVPALPAVLRHAAPRALATAACVVVGATGLRALAGADVPPLAWWPGFPGQPFTLAPDALSAPFVTLLGAVGAWPV